MISVDNKFYCAINSPQTLSLYFRIVSISQYTLLCVLGDGPLNHKALNCVRESGSMDSNCVLNFQSPLEGKAQYSH